MAEDENKPLEENNEDHTVRIDPGDMDTQTNKNPEYDDESTQISDPDETIMGDMPDPAMLALGAKLVVISQQDTGKEFFLSDKETLIGRGDDCNLKLNYPGVSRRHLEIFYKEDSLYFQDMGSKYGTLVDSVQIKDETEVKSGSKIQIGELILKLVIGEEKATFDLKKNKVALVGIGVGVFIVLMLFLKLIIGGKDAAEVNTASTTVTKSHQHNPQIEKDLNSALKEARAGNLTGALKYIDLVLNQSTDHEKAIELQKKWRNQLSLNQVLTEANELIAAGQLDQAKAKVGDVLTSMPENQDAGRLLKLIQQKVEEKKAKGVLADVEDLINQNRLDAALNLIQTISKPEMKDQVEALKAIIEKQKKAKVFEDKADKNFTMGNFEKALEDVRSGLRENNSTTSLKKMEAKIEKVIAIKKQISLKKSTSKPKEIFDLIDQLHLLLGSNNTYTNELKEIRAQLDSRGIVLAHKSYQEALIYFSENRPKEALDILDQLIATYPKIVSFLDTRNEVISHMDNLAKALFRAAYIIEPDDPLKAKEIYRKILNYVPKNHDYYRKARAKIR